MIPQPLIRNRQDVSFGSQGSTSGHLMPSSFLLQAVQRAMRFVPTRTENDEGIETAARSAGLM